MGTRGNFFAVDRRVWAQVCDLGKMNLAIAYLVLARGTLGDLRTTAWSVNAIEDRTAVPRLAAKAAIQGLVDAGFVERRRGGTKPLYFIRSAEAVHEVRAAPPPVLTQLQSAVLDVVKANPNGIIPPRKHGKASGWPEGAPHHSVAGLERLGLVRRLQSGAVVAVEPPRAPTPDDAADWIWLPNTLVDGAEGSQAPVERVRQSQSIAAVRLLVDLYHAQSLSVDGGVNWRTVRMTHDQHKIWEGAEFDVYAFRPKQLEGWQSAPFIAPHLTGQHQEVQLADGQRTTQDTGWPTFWEALGVLRDTGVASLVTTLIEADSAEGTVMHPLACPGEGEEVEQALGEAAHRAGLALLPPGLAGQLQPGSRVVPILRHHRRSTVVGLVRLRHRANTSATAAWYARAAEWRSMAERYKVLEAAAGWPAGQGAFHATSTGHQRGINGTSTRDQRQG